MLREQDIPVIADVRASAQRFKGLSDVAKSNGAGRIAAEHAACARVLQAMTAAAERVLKEVNAEMARPPPKPAAQPQARK